MSNGRSQNETLKKIPSQLRQRNRDGKNKLAMKATGKDEKIKIDNARREEVGP